MLETQARALTIQVSLLTGPTFLRFNNLQNCASEGMPTAPEDTQILTTLHIIGGEGTHHDTPAYRLIHR
jgi:hypothetical protein